MSAKNEIEKNIKRVEAELADMKVSLANMKEAEKTLAIFKGDVVVGKRCGRILVWMVTYATPSKATLRGLNKYSKDIESASLGANHSVKCNQRDVAYNKIELTKVCTFAEAQAYID